jgi:hypothetical protein
LGELLRKKFQIEERDVRTVMLNMTNRERFSYNWKDTAAYLLRCLCIRTRNLKELSKKEFLFDKGD